MSKKGMFRINARIAPHTNEWLDEQSEKIGISKSAVINLALEHYKNYKEQAGQLEQFSDLVERMEKLAGK